jgi:hypothetical protein
VLRLPLQRPYNKAVHFAANARSQESRHSIVTQRCAVCKSSGCSVTTAYSLE